MLLTDNKQSGGSCSVNYYYYNSNIRNIHSDNWLLIKYKLNYIVLPDKNEIRVIRRQRRLLGLIILAPFFLLIEVQSLVPHLIEKKLFQGKFPRNHEKTVDRGGTNAQRL